MARSLRPSAGDVIYHVLNRGNGRRTIFHKPADAVAFLNLLHGLRQEIPVRLLAYCLMGNHWHLVLWPRGEGELSRFMHRLTVTHVRRYFQHYHDDAGGHLYQGRFKSFPVQDDPHLLALCAYVEANALRAGLVARAEQWRWSSLHLLHGGRAAGVLDEWPTARPARADWIERVAVNAENFVGVSRLCAGCVNPEIAVGVGVANERAARETGRTCFRHRL